MNLVKSGKRYFERRTPRLDLLIFAVLLALTWSVYEWSNGALWSEQIGLATVFCVLIWMKDDSPAGRWLIIVMIAAGTIAAIFFSM